jgi:hypothetical protein
MSCPHCGNATAKGYIEVAGTRMRCASCRQVIEANVDGTFPIPFTTRGLPIIDRLRVWWWRRKDRRARAEETL